MTQARDLADNKFTGDVEIDTDTLVVDSANNRVGIGTSSPASILEIQGSRPYFNIDNTSGAGGDFSGIAFSTAGTTRASIQYDPGNNFLQFNGFNNTERMRIDSSGNVGIGTTSLNISSGYQTLSINGSTGAQLAFQTGGEGKQFIFSTSTDLDIYNSQAGNIKFTTSATERMRLDSNGNLLMGGTAYGGVGLSLAKPDSSGVFSIFSGTGTGYHVRFGSATYGVQGSITTSSSSTQYNTSSDYRLKEDWQPMTGAIERVNALNPVNFAWKADGSRVDGFIAHEAQAVVPEAVHGQKDAMREEEYEVTPAVIDEDGNVVTKAVMGTRSVPDYQGIDQSKLVPLLTAALQEAIAKIETLETKVAALENN